MGACSHQRELHLQTMEGPSLPCSLSACRGKDCSCALSCKYPDEEVPLSYASSSRTNEDFSFDEHDMFDDEEQWMSAHREAGSAHLPRSSETGFCIEKRSLSRDLSPTGENLDFHTDFLPRKRIAVSQNLADNSLSFQGDASFFSIDSKPEVGRGDCDDKTDSREPVYGFGTSRLSLDQATIQTIESLEGNDYSGKGSPDQSFKESFYSSGTDWSCLYEVDEYGMPYNGPDGCETTNAPKVDIHKIDKKCYTEVLGKKWKKQQPRKQVCGKLVQCSLTACWGNKPKVLPMGMSYCKEQVITEPKEFAVPTADFWAKFKCPSDLSSSVAAKQDGGNLRSKVARTRSDVKAQPAYPARSCPFYKKIPGTSFTVDAFCFGAVEGCLAYFLTHFHSDHYGGLTKSWSHGTIYCTPVTARLLVLCLSVNERWICPMPLGTTRVIEGVEVKMLEANHCPGAAIILFRLRNGQCVLHTGDFRACKRMQSYPELVKSHISTLYLDTTYCNPRYRFPSQKEVIDFVVETTQAALKRNSKTLVVVGSYSIGKERVYLGIAEALEVSIFAERRRSRILMALDWPELAGRLCADAGRTMLHVLPIGFLRPQKLKAYLQGYPRFTSVLAFRPTGWTYSEKIGNQLHLLKPVISGPTTIYGVPYSEHSSFTELRDFVQFLQPEKIIPTVNNGRPLERDRMQSLFRQWLRK